MSRMENRRAEKRGVFFRIMLIVLCVLSVLFVVLAIRVFGVLPDWKAERGATPTPVPFYGNVMRVTRDPSQPTPVPALHNGDAGERVIRLQNRLAELGYYTGTVTASSVPVRWTPSFASRRSMA